MNTRSVNPRNTYGVSRREVLHAGLAAGAALSAWPFYKASPFWGGEAGTRKHGSILCVRGGDPPHFDPPLTINNYTNYLLSFTHSRLVQHTAGADVQLGTFLVEPDLAERWEELDDTTTVFHLRKEGAKYYRYDPKESRRLLAKAGHPKGFKTHLTVTGGLGRDLIDDAQLMQRFLKAAILRSTPTSLSSPPPGRRMSRTMAPTIASTTGVAPPHCG